MKRKVQPPAEAVESAEIVVPEALLEQARRAIDSERMRKPTPCVVCSGECTSDNSEGLCWVCRRLKLSAWRDSDSQMPAQE
ncbi:MAG: hypothetical protein ABIR70_04500 [Bryobacteraceae bacterium]